VILHKREKWFVGIIPYFNVIFTKLLHALFPVGNRSKPQNTPTQKSVSVMIWQTRHSQAKRRNENDMKLFPRPKANNGYLNTGEGDFENPFQIYVLV
jgi:hypothetical protein